MRIAVAVCLIDVAFCHPSLDARDDNWLLLGPGRCFMNYDTTASRFFRPSDPARLRRNQRRIQVQRLLVILRGVALVTVIAIAATAAYRHTQSNARFAVRSIEIEGATHTPRSAIDRVTSQYVGLNLFKIDIARVQHDLAPPGAPTASGLGWVERIAIEKKLPDVLRIKITERLPVALVRKGDRLLYTDQNGLGFAELSASAGDDDLPIITDAEGAELVRTVALLGELKRADAQLYSRVSEVWPIPPRGFAMYDRALGAVVYANADDIAAKWRNLYAVLAAENHPKIEYADLRFANRLIVKKQDISRDAGELEKTNAQN